ncbi:unnamed protein product [Hymenolepis diminuta]|uniref:Amidase domain-containing protein n=1 Tax=Hymenolepis diminuta TaxID=6216 RepID=A0A0R3SL54_HYMDI|nr:unnamed protein product [Hymenolepis diminuta]
MVMDVPEDVKVVPGIEQGYDAWLAVNYLEGKFGTPTTETAKPAEDLLGALNMGGASSQIAFYTTAAIQSADDKYDGVVFGKEYNLYCHTNLCYGIGTLRDRYLALLASRARTFTDPIASPCHPKYFSVTVQTNSIFQSPCVSHTDNGITGPPIIKPWGIPDSITFGGSYSMRMCLSVIDELFEGTPFEQPQRPPLSGDFAAIHKIWETVNAFVGGTALRIKMSLSRYTDIVDNFCRQDWRAVRPFI